MGWWRAVEAGEAGGELHLPFRRLGARVESPLRDPRGSVKYLQFR